MLNNLQMGQNQQGQNGQQGQMRQQMDKLGDLMRRQKEMMNETHRLEQQRQNGMQQDYGQNEQGQPGNQGQMSEEDIAKALRGLQEGQDKLQSDLEQMMKDLRGLGINPGKDFGEAGKSMGEAGKSLGEADGGQALDQQGNALDALRRGGQDMMKQWQQAMGQDGQTGPGGQQQNGRRDPLGRPQRGPEGLAPEPGNMLPGEIDIQRARQILDEIRRRLGNALSPQIEKDYLERLLKFDLVRDNADIGQLPERMADIHAISHDKIVRTFKTFEIGFDVGLALHALVEQHSNGNAAGAALQHQFAGELQRPARFQNIVDQQNIASMDIAVDIAQQAYLAAFCSLAIA